MGPEDRKLVAVVDDEENLRRTLCFALDQAGYRTASYPEDTYVNDRTIDCHIKRLRKKLHAVDQGFPSIDTIYGLGYRYS